MPGFSGTGDDLGTGKKVKNTPFWRRAKTGFLLFPVPGFSGTGDVLGTGKK